MQTISAQIAAETIRSWNIDLSDRERARRRFRVPEQVSKLAWFCRFVETSLGPWDECLLWVTEWGIWESSENMPLYYRLRGSYGITTRIDDEPAHLFLQSESSDLVSFLQLALSAGWGCRLIPNTGDRRVFVSHDEWIEFETCNEIDLENIAAALA